MGFLTGSSSAPKAPKPPPVPTQTRRQAQRELDARIGADNFIGSDSSGINDFFGRIKADSLQNSLDNKPDSAFLPPVEQRDFQSLDAQIRGGSEPQINKNRNRDMMSSLLELLGEDVDSPTIL